MCNCVISVCILFTGTNMCMYMRSCVRVHLCTLEDTFSHAKIMPNRKRAAVIPVFKTENWTSNMRSCICIVSLRLITPKCSLARPPSIGGIIRNTLSSQHAKSFTYNN